MQKQYQKSPIRLLNMIDGHNMNEVEQNEYDADFSIIGCTNAPMIADEIIVYWSDDDTYYPATVQSIEDDQKTIHYDEGDVEKQSMQSEIWIYRNYHNNELVENPSSLQVVSNEDQVLQDFVELFGNKAILKHESQGFQQFPLLNTHEKEEEHFLRTVDIIFIFKHYQ